MAVCRSIYRYLEVDTMLEANVSALARFIPAQGITINLNMPWEFRYLRVAINRTLHRFESWLMSQRCVSHSPHLPRDNRAKMWDVTSQLWAERSRCPFVSRTCRMPGWSGKNG
jgi:hypothetical protein